MICVLFGDRASGLVIGGGGRDGPDAVAHGSHVLEGFQRAQTGEEFRLHIAQSGGPMSSIDKQVQ